MSVSNTRKLLILVVILSVLAGVLLALRFTSAPTINQPVAFSHRTHAVDKKIDCSFCHESVEQQAIAGIPRTQVCVTCHSGIESNHPEIKKIFEYYERKEEIPWVRVYQMPEHVFFSHKRHVKAEIACSVCHGKMGESTKAVREVHHTMGSCMECHREKNASLDCWTCHK